jgi:hypothetical protein
MITDAALRSMLQKRGSLSMRLEKIMIVGAHIPHSLNDVFRSWGRNVAHVRDGKRAVLRAEREIFDAAILISTGKEMDLAETVFNLSDINHSMELIILSDRTPRWESAVSTDTLARLIPNAVVMSTQDLKKHLNGS